MRTHRQGRTGAAPAVSRETHAGRLVATLRRISRQLRRAQPDRAARAGYRLVEQALAGLAARFSGRKRRR